MLVTIKHIKRLKNSYCGNPAFELTFVGGLKMRTKANTSDAYKICDSYLNKTVNIKTQKVGRSNAQQIIGID